MSLSAPHEPQPVDVLDLAVVGAGVAGLYVGWKADAERYPRRAVFDAAPTLGAQAPSRRVRHGSGFFDGELGARCVEWGLQPMFRGLMDELGLAVQDLPPSWEAELPADRPPGAGASPFGSWRRAFLDVLRQFLLFLPPHLRVEGGLRDPDAWLPQLGEPHFAWLRSDAELLRGDLGVRMRLADVGIWNLLRWGGVLAKSRLSELVEEGAFYHFAHRNISAAEAIVFWIRILKSNASLKTHAGSAAILDGLAARVRAAGVPIQLGHRVTRLSSVRSGERLVCLQLATAEGVERVIHARQVVLALPQPALVRLETAFPADVRGILGEVMPMRVSRRFFLVQDPSWAEDAAAVSVGLDPRASSAIHHFSSGDRGAGRVMGAAPERGVCSPTVDWNQVPHPAGEAWFWRPGARASLCMGRLAGFDLAGEEAAPGGPQLHVCGGAFSDFQGFVEGALRTATTTLEALAEAGGRRPELVGRAEAEGRRP